MKAKVPFDLLAKFITGQGTPEENRQAGEWIELNRETRKIYTELKEIWERTRKDPQDFTPDLEKALESVNSKLNQDNHISIPITSRFGNLPGLLARAAAILLLVAGCWLVFNQIQHRGMTDYANTTGKPVDITLPDGSVVTINVNTVLHYPHQFRRQKREVQLTGEAYFRVTKSQERPFIINTANSIIRVLGTSFNIRAMKNEDLVVVNVEEGRVEFGSAIEKEIPKVELTAGETGILEKGRKLSRTGTTDNNYLAWKTGILTFSKTPIDEVIGAVEKYFFVTIRSENDNLDSITVDITLFNENEAEMIQAIEMLIGYEIIAEDSVYIITEEPI